MTPQQIGARNFWCPEPSESEAPAGLDAPPPRPEEIRKIIHIDMDAFYASVEQRDDPALRGRPVAVGGTSQRGVVAAASYEARRYGVRSAMPSVTARRRCPDLVFVKPRFEIYKAVSRQIRAIFAEYTPKIEPLSLDEAYLDVTSNLKNEGSATRIAEEIRARIFAETQLTASAGVSYNKFLAKLASDHRKPNGLFVVTPAEGPRFVEGLAIGKFHGIGPVTAAKMNRLGIMTGLDLRLQSEAVLNAHFGKAGRYYFDLARGIDHRTVSPDRIRKSVGSETTFFEDLTTAAALAEGLRPAVESVWSHCTRSGSPGRTVTVKAKYSDFKIVTRSRTLSRPVASRDELEAIGLDLVDTLLPLEKSIRLLGLSMSGFDPAEPEPDRQMILDL